MRPKRRRSRPKGSKAAPPAEGKKSPGNAPPSDERGSPAAPPAPPAEQAPPKPEPPPEPVPDPRVGELQEQVSQLTSKLEGLSHQEGGDVDERFQGMEDRMKSLLQLSEILSVRYNPFLEEEEQSLYDDRPPEQFLPESMASAGKAAPAAKRRRAAPASDVPAGAEVVPIEPDPDVPMGPATVAHADDLDAAMSWIGPPEQPIVDALVEAEQATPPRAPAKAPPAEPAPSAPRPKPSAPTPAPAIAQATSTPPGARPTEPPQPREAWPRQAANVPAAPDVRPAPRAAPPRAAYFALCWFERLAAAGDPSEIHLFLDHYERLGWIPAEDRAWLRQLAVGIAPPRDDLSWDDLHLTGPDLARLHRDHLRFLERLFRTGCADDDPDSWERQADGLLGGR